MTQLKAQKAYLDNPCPETKRQLIAVVRSRFAHIQHPSVVKAERDAQIAESLFKPRSPNAD